MGGRQKIRNKSRKCRKKAKGEKVKGKERKEKVFGDEAEGNMVNRMEGKREQSVKERKGYRNECQ